MPRLRSPFVLVLLGLFLALLPGSAAHADPHESARTDGVPKVLRVGTEGVYAPFSYRAKGKLTGFDIDVMNAIGKKLGVKVKYVETPWDSMFGALAADRFDLVANQVTYNDERAALYDLSKPYVETTGVLVVAKDNHDITKIADLKGKRSAQNLTSNWAEVAKGAGATVVGVDGMTEAITDLRQGRVDAMVNDKLAVRNYLATTKNSGVKVVAETDDTSLSVFAARKGTGYMPQINQAIDELRADGTLKKIYDKYFTARPAPVSRWQLVKDNAWPMLKATVKVTIPLTAISFALGLLIALAIALMRMSAQPVVAGIARAFISVVRGTPLLLQLFLIFYGLPELGVKFSPFPAAVIAFSVNVGGYGAEIIRAAIQSIPRGQWEAAETIGMDYRTTLRRIVLPQAARTAVPPLSNTLISLVKDTSLASTILVVDLFQQTRIAAAPTFQYFTLFAVAAVYYWVICLALSFLQSRTETRLNRFVAA